MALQRALQNGSTGLEYFKSPRKKVSCKRSRDALRVTDGEFSRELEQALLSTRLGAKTARAVIALLERSRTFRNVACTLDKRYLAFSGRTFSRHCSDSGRDWREVCKPNRDGVLSDGPNHVRGKRVLEVSFVPGGSEFWPAGSLDNLYGDRDFIWLQPPPSDASQARRLVWLVERIVHEAVHAFRLNASAPGRSRRARIAACIQEESRTRQTTADILIEIQAQTATRRNTALINALGRQIGLTKTGAANVERDFFPGEPMTYLEHCVLGDLVKEQADFEFDNTDFVKASDAVAALKEEVDNLTFVVAPDKLLKASRPSALTVDSTTGLKPVFVSGLFELLLIQRAVHKRWRHFLKRQEVKNQPTSRAFIRAKERVLQDHVAAFFPETIRYTPTQLQ